MHEMSLCEGIRDIVVQQAAAHQAARVTRVRLEIGRLAGVEKPAMEFAWEVVMKGSPAEGATLEMLDLPATAACMGCGEIVEIEHRFAPCPACGSGQLVPRTGDEMRIKDLEVI